MLNFFSLGNKEDAIDFEEKISVENRFVFFIEMVFYFTQFDMHKVFVNMIFSNTLSKK